MIQTDHAAYSEDFAARQYEAFRVLAANIRDTQSFIEYGNKCLITGYEATEVLEACHIGALPRPKTSHPSNPGDPFPTVTR